MAIHLCLRKLLRTRHADALSNAVDVTEAPASDTAKACRLRFSWTRANQGPSVRMTITSATNEERGFVKLDRVKWSGYIIATALSGAAVSAERPSHRLC